MNNKKDYKFRYRITSELSGKVEKPVEDYFKEEIMNLLNIVIVTSRGREMKIDGFKFVNDPKKIIPLK